MVICIPAGLKYCLKINACYFKLCDRDKLNYHQSDGDKEHIA